MSVDEFKQEINAQKTPIRRNVLNAFDDYVRILSDYDNNYVNVDEEPESLDEAKTKKITKSQLKEMILKETKNALNEISVELLAKNAGRAYNKNRREQSYSFMNGICDRLNQKYNEATNGLLSFEFDDSYHYFECIVHGSGLCNIKIKSTLYNTISIGAFEVFQNNRNVQEKSLDKIIEDVNQRIIYDIPNALYYEKGDEIRKAVIEGLKEFSKIVLKIQKG